VSRLLIALALGVVAVGVAVLLQRRQRADAPVRTGYTVPDQIDPGDLARPGAPWTVVVFTSATCDSCAGVWDKARLLESGDVAIEEVRVGFRRDLHDRYRIDAVPTTVVVDAAGVVRASFLGPVTATDLWAAVAELREPGSTPGACSA
jgi:hypothetical protein